MRTIDRDGTRLAFEDVGSGSPSLVFVHGWTCNHGHFAPQIEHFRRSHRVIAVDLRGHGRSDAPEQSYTVSAFADDVAWLCREVGLDRPVLVGHSMGATVVLDVAARHPGVPGAIVMLDAAPIVPATTATVAADLTALAEAGGGELRASLIEHAVAGLAGDPELQDRVRRDMTAVPDHVALSCIAAMGEWDGAAAAGACTVPGVHIAAEDPINDAAALRAMNPLLRTGQTVGAGHFNHLEAPVQVNAMIERFLVSRDS